MQVENPKSKIKNPKSMMTWDSFKQSFTFSSGYSLPESLRVIMLIISKLNFIKLFQLHL